MKIFQKIKVSTLILFSILLYGWLFLTVQCTSKKETTVADYETYLNGKKEENDQNKNVKLNEVEEKCIHLIELGNKETKLWDKETPKANDYFEKSIVLAKKHNLTSLEIFAKLNYAQYLYQFRNMPRSLPVVIDLTFLIEKTSENNIIYSDETYQFLGYYYMTIQQYKEAQIYLQKAINVTYEHQKLSSLYDNVGIIYLKQNKKELAEKSFNKALKIATTYNDELRIGKIYGNLSQIYIDEMQVDKAIALLNEDVVLSKKHQAKQNTMFALIQLSKAYEAKQNIKKSDSLLHEAIKIAESKSYFKSSELEILILLKGIAMRTNDTINELKYRRKIELLKKDLSHTDGPESITNTQYHAQLSAVNLQMENEKSKLKEINTNNKILILVLVFVLVLSTLTFININRKFKIEKTEHQNILLTAEIDKINSENKLKAAHHSIDSYFQYLNEKNQHIETLNKKINSLEKSSTFHKNEKINDLQKLLKSHLMTDENWFRFRKTFMEAYPDYFEYLTTQFEDLTESNLRLIILLKLGLNTKELQNILGISADAVKKAKQRLRKKLGDKYDSLFEISNE